MFGAPFIMQSDNGLEFANKIIQNLADMCPGMKLVHGNRDILKFKDRLKDPTKMFETCCLLGCPTTTRKPGLKDYGLSKARNTEHSGIKTSPYEAMFGRAQRIGLGDSLLTEDMYCSTETEELEQLFNVGMNNGRDKEDKEEAN